MSTSLPKEYCFKININGDLTDTQKETVRAFVRELYRSKRYANAYINSSEELPFIVLVSSKKKMVCIKPRRTKTNIARIEALHAQMKSKHLKISSDIALDKPTEFVVEQHEWWGKEAPARMAGHWWTTLEHNGPYFVWIDQPYEPHGVPLVYNGKKIHLSPEAEEVANFYAKRITTDKTATISHTTDKVFNDNFWDDFRKYLTPDQKKTMTTLSKVNWEPIRLRLVAIKDGLSTAAKKRKKVSAAERSHEYGFAVVNGAQEPIAGFTIEAAALFLGRGENTDRGRIKRNIRPDEVTLNMSADAKVPLPPLKADGTRWEWKEVVHKQDNRWIMRWKDPLSGSNKYVYISQEGQFKAQSDMGKFEIARKLHHYVSDVRRGYQHQITSSNIVERQLGTVAYMVDHHGIRIGGPNDDSTADTFGATTLLVEHASTRSPNKVLLEFLGKDSILFKQTMTVPRDIYNNVKEFIKDKKPSADLFDRVTHATINDYLHTFDKDISAKVFRTRLGSSIMYNALAKTNVPKGASQAVKKAAFEKANILVAEALNHQKTVSKKAQSMVEKYKVQLNELKEKRKGDRSTASLEKRIETKIRQIDSKENTLSIALGTSMVNYVDPRIVTAWCKKNEMDIGKAYSPTLQRKFKWAIDTIKCTWDYLTTPLMPGYQTMNPKLVSDSSPTKATRKKTATKHKGKDKVVVQVDAGEHLRRMSSLLGRLGYSLVRDGENVKVVRTGRIPLAMHVRGVYSQIYDTALQMTLQNRPYLAVSLIGAVCKDASENTKIGNVLVSTKLIPGMQRLVDSAGK